MIYHIVFCEVILRRNHLRAKKALKTFIFWVSMAIIVNLGIIMVFGKQHALEFLSGYIVELSLSVDNLFLFLMIFTTFNIELKYQKRVLTYGIIGAIILRFIFIWVGVVIVNKFHWILYIFSFFLFASGLKIFFSSEEVTDFKESRLLKILSKIIPVREELQNEKFFVKEGNIILATPLFLILVLIESSDILFALDSIPAIFSITTNPYIVYSSNIFAILGLRSLYFVLAKLNTMFYYIKYGVGFILIFTGIKLFLGFFSITISTSVSLLVILIILLICVLISLMKE